MRIARRLWWATLPFYGWTGYAGEDGAVPPPWWAFPLSVLHRLIDRTVFRHRDVFGPAFNAGTGWTSGKPWQ